MADQIPAAQDTPAAASGNAKPDAPATIATGTTPAATETGKPADDASAAKPDATGKPAEGTPDPTKAAEGKTEAEKTGAPEKYEFKLPDGVTMDDGLLKAAEPVLRELNLTNEQANKLAGVVAAVRQADAKAAEEAFAAQAETWVGQVKSDPTMGGQHFDSTVLAAQKAVSAFGSPDLKALLTETGLGNHPEVVRFCAQIGKAISEDKLNRPADVSSTNVTDAAAKLYTHPTSKHTR